jgi:Family of unknown function (DUF6499)
MVCKPLFTWLFCLAGELCVHKSREYVMPQGSWLNAEGYAASMAFPSSALAGEYLARNLRYLKDRKRLDGRARRNELREQDRVAFAADWGILYREDGSTPWAASAYSLQQLRLAGSNRQSSSPSQVQRQQQQTSPQRVM